MADPKLSNLTELAATPAAGDLLYIVDISESDDDDKSKKITVDNLLDYGAVYLTEHIGLPEAPSTTGKATQYDLTSGAGDLAGEVQTDYPRNVVLFITDGDASISALSVTITGTLATGTASTETITETTAGAHAGSKAWAQITNIEVDSVTGAAAGDTLDVGWGEKIGLMNAISASSDILKVTIDQTDSAVASQTVNATNNTVVFASAPNGTRIFKVFYKSRS